MNSEVNKVINLGTSLSKLIKLRKEKIINILSTYETIYVAEDEISRSVDFLENLEENKEYFSKKVDKVISFLPINQPLYALVSFGIVPAFMSKRVFVRPPAIARVMMKKLVEILNLENTVPNLHISFNERKSFIKDHLNDTNVVIFTGKPENAHHTQEIFGDNVLFIGNGASHNPVVISQETDIDSAVRAVIEVQLYNQGGDCAAPNSILVENSVYNKFLDKLHIFLQNVKVGLYTDKDVMVGPFLDKKHFKSTLGFIEKNKIYLDPEIMVNFDKNRGILWPTIILKPLEMGGNYEELYAPIFIIQRYKNDSDLSKYFENEKYTKHAGYVTLFGKSDYIEKIINTKFFNDTIFHPKETIIKNNHLHAKGVERGVKPYGGYGSYSSFVSYKGKTVSKPTLPQRDIFEFLLKG